MKIGITGGIGSGKSTACKLLEQWGYPVYYSDDRGKYLMEFDPEVRRDVQKLFGENAYLDGRLNRTLLADQIFKSPEKRQQLNAIVHPAVKRDYENWLQEHSEETTFKESALLFETGAYKDLDATILITAPDSVRIARVMLRDGVSEEAVRNRIKVQMPENEKQALADHIIVNTERFELEEQLQGVLKKLQE
ncbi:MAG: dephospho-CoA kinase [Fluviicola sp.]|jgi:dephospho-CoA kinase